MTRPNFWLGIAISHAPECLAETELRRALSRKLLSALIFRSSDKSKTAWNLRCLGALKSISSECDGTLLIISQVGSSPGTIKFWSNEVRLTCSLPSTNDVACPIN